MFSGKRRFYFSEYVTKKSDENDKKQEVHTINQIDTSQFDNDNNHLIRK